MQPLVLDGGIYSASLDGMTLEGDLILEVKCPVRGTRSDLWQDVAGGTVPEHYTVQIQHQLMVSRAEKAHLWIFNGEVGILHEIVPDHDLMERIRTAWDGFQQYLDGDTPPPLTDADTVIRQDAAWTEAAQAFAAAKQAAEATAETLDAGRLALVALAQHPKEIGAGVSVTRFFKVGNVDYKKVPALQGVDLATYRGKSREEVRVSVN